MSPAQSPIKETRAKTSYTLTFEISIDIHHDNTSGRFIENVASDIEDFLSDNDEFWETFPSVIGTAISIKDIHHNYNEIIAD